MKLPRVLSLVRRLMVAVAGAALTQAAPLQAGDDVPLATATRLLELPGRTDAETRVAVSGDGRRVAVAGAGRGVGRSDSRTLTLDVATGREVRAAVGRGLYLTALTLSHDGRRLATGGPARWVQTGGPVGSMGTSPVGVIIEVWDVDSGEVVRTIEADNAPHELAFSPDGARLLAFSGSRYNLSVWDLGTGDEVFGTPAKDRDRSVLGGVSAEFFPYGVFSRNRAYAVSPNFEAPPRGFSPAQRVWDVAGRRSRTSFGTGNWVTDAIRAVDDRGGRVVRGGDRVVDSVTGQVAFRLDPEPRGDRWPGASYAMTWDEPRHWIIGGDTLGTVRVWDDRTGRLLAHVKASPGKPVRAVDSTPGGIVAVTGGWRLMAAGRLEYDASPVLWKITPPTTP